MNVSLLLQVFPFLSDVEANLLDELGTSCQQVTLPAGRDLATAGQRYEALPLVLRGSVRVFALSEEGRETTLYRVGPGESCILTAGCLLDSVEFPAFARTEVESQALFVPSPLLRRWIATSPPWSAYVVSLATRRLTQTVLRMHQLLYRPLESKLVEFVLEQADDRRTVHRTHAEIGAEIGSAREAVSRCLKELERAGLLHLKRGAVVVADADGLRLRTGLPSAV